MKRPKPGAAGLGATGRFPMPALDDSDEGELALAVGYDPVMGLVRIDFGKPVAWLALPKDKAMELGLSLLKHAGAKTVQIGI